MYTLERDTGTKSIDVRTWFGMDNNSCYIDIYFRESDFTNLESRVFYTDRYRPGRLYINTDKALFGDLKTWNLVAKAYNSCNNYKYYYQYFKVIIEAPGPDCADSNLLPATWKSTAL